MTNPPPSVASSPDVESAPAAEASRPAVVGAASFSVPVTPLPGMEPAAKFHSLSPMDVAGNSFDPGPCGFDLMRSRATTLRVAHSSAIHVHSSSSDISKPSSVRE